MPTHSRQWRATACRKQDQNRRQGAQQSAGTNAPTGAGRRAEASARRLASMTLACSRIASSAASSSLPRANSVSSAALRFLHALFVRFGIAWRCWGLRLKERRNKHCHVPRVVTQSHDRVVSTVRRHQKHSRACNR